MGFFDGLFKTTVRAIPIVGDYLNQKDANKTAQQATTQQLAGIAQGRTDLLNQTGGAQETLAPLIAQGAAQYGGLNSFGQQSLGQQSQAISGANQEQAQLGSGISALKGQQGNLNVSEFLDPSMAFTMQEGMKALDASAAARGGLLSGAALKSALEYSQGLASQNYDNAVTQAMANRNQQIGIGQNLTQIGQQGVDTNRAIAGTGAQVSSGLYDTGASALTNKANIQTQVGSDLANMSMNAGNVAAGGTAAQQNPYAVAGKAAASMLQQNAGEVKGFLKDVASSVFSDEDLKEDVGEITDDDIDEFLNNLKPKSFKYNETGLDKGAPEGEHTGIMAQDAEKSKIGRTLVEKDEEGYRKIDVPQTVGALLATSANLNKRLKALESKKGGK